MPSRQCEPNRNTPAPQVTTTKTVIRMAWRGSGAVGKVMLGAQIAPPDPPVAPQHQGQNHQRERHALLQSDGGQPVPLRLGMQEFGLEHSDAEAGSSAHAYRSEPAEQGGSEGGHDQQRRGCRLDPSDRRGENHCCACQHRGQHPVDNTDPVRGDADQNSSGFTLGACSGGQPEVAEAI